MAFEGITTGAVAILENLIAWSALFSLLIISLLVTIISTLAYKYLTDQKMIKEHKDHMKKLQEEMKSLKDNPNLMMEKQKEMMQKNLGIMKSSLKPMLFTFIPFLIIFLWLRTAYEPVGKIAFGMTWLWIYIISSIIFSIILRKILKVY